MNNLKNYKDFVNEAKIGIVNFSDLHDNWSAEYNLSDELKVIKKDYKKLGIKKIIEKVVDIVSKLDEKTYNKLIAESKKKYFITLPKYISAKNKLFWVGKNKSVSRIIILMGALTSGLDEEKEKIPKEIENLQNKLDSLDKIDEGNSTSEWLPWGNTVFNEYNPDNEDNYEYIGYNQNGELGDEPLESYDNIYDFGEEIPNEKLEEYISLETLKTMMPVYNDVDFYKDWSVRMYKYENFFGIMQSGWMYLFRKK